MRSPRSRKTGRRPATEHGVDDVGDRHRGHQDLALRRQIERSQDREERDAGVRQQHGLPALQGRGEAPLERLDAGAADRRREGEGDPLPDPTQIGEVELPARSLR